MYRLPAPLLVRYQRFFCWSLFLPFALNTYRLFALDGPDSLCCFLRLYVLMFYGFFFFFRILTKIFSFSAKKYRHAGTVISMHETAILFSRTFATVCYLFVWISTQISYFPYYEDFSRQFLMFCHVQAIYGSAQSLMFLMSRRNLRLCILN